MKVRLVPSSFSAPGSSQDQFLTSYLVNQSLAIDAGCIGFFGSPQEQARIRHVLISHTHIDHVASLPTFLENAYQAGPECVTVHGSETVLESLQRDLFNGRVWPDLVAISAVRPPYLKLATLHPGQPVALEGLKITPVAVHHAVPTMGFIVEDEASAIAITSDTGPTDEIWERANATPHLKAVFVEVSFPDDMAALAQLAGHLTAATAAQELRKLTKRVPVLAVHLKAQVRVQVAGELQALGLPDLALARCDRGYEF